jgi:anthranilate synthase component 2
MKVLLLDNYDSFTYNLAQLIEEANIPDLTLDIIYNDKIELKEVQKYDKILLSPGPGIPSEAGSLLPLIQQYASSKSILGVCLGHQAIAEVFGARVINLNQIYHGLAHQVNILTDDIVFSDLPRLIEVGLYHSWAVQREAFPESLEITAISEKGIIMGLKHRLWDVSGVQFHPESVMTPLGAKMIENWLNAY